MAFQSGAPYILWFLCILAIILSSLRRKLVMTGFMATRVQSVRGSTRLMYMCSPEQCRISCRSVEWQCAFFLIVWDPKYNMCLERLFYQPMFLIRRKIILIWIRLRDFANLDPDQSKTNGQTKTKLDFFHINFSVFSRTTALMTLGQNCGPGRSGANFYFHFPGRRAPSWLDWRPPRWASRSTWYPAAPRSSPSGKREGKNQEWQD